MPKNKTKKGTTKRKKRRVVQPEEEEKEAVPQIQDPRRQGVRALLDDEMEGAIYAWAMAHPEEERGDMYHDKAKQVIFALKKNPSLRKAYREDVLVMLEDDTRDVDERTQRVQRIDHLYSLLDVASLDDENLAAKGPMATCAKCGNTDIDFESHQTRGADEAATIFWFCNNPKCMHRWKTG